MKKWIIIIVVVLVALIAIGIFYEAGYLHFKSSTLSALVAALACPYMFIKNKLFNRNSPESVNDIINRAKDGLINDEEHRTEYDAQVFAKEQEINELKAQVNHLTTQIQNKTAEEEAVHTAVREMSSDEISREFEKLYYANEKDD